MRDNMLDEDFDPILDELYEISGTSDTRRVTESILHAIDYIEWLKENLNTDHRYYYDQDTH